MENSLEELGVSGINFNITIHFDYNWIDPDVTHKRRRN